VSDAFLPVPPRTPRRHSKLVRALARGAMRIGGWRMAGAFPDLDKVVMIAAPHSSAWDAIWGLLVKVGLGLDIKFMAKQELFWWPLGNLLRALGGLPTDRHAPNGVVGQMVQRYRDSEKFWMVLAPEGTRKRVEKWKTGFWHVAVGAGVPVVCVYFHYPERIVGIGETMTMSGNLDADMARIREYYKPFQGKHRGT
jgi:1-acyl-sn-glycerol-3-phosphate acyltransferase